jgi:hypothetical protein
MTPATATAASSATSAGLPHHHFPATVMSQSFGGSPGAAGHFPARRHASAEELLIDTLELVSAKHPILVSFF